MPEPTVRLMLGDCLERMAEIETGSVDLVLADLPYGTTACRWDQVIPFEPLWTHYRHILKPRGAVVLTASQPFTSMLVMSNREWFKYEWVWIRGKRVSGHLDVKRRPMRKHENVLVFAPSPPRFYPIKIAGPRRKSTGGNDGSLWGKQNGKTPYLSYERYPTDIIDIDSVDPRHRDHPTQKPVALFEYLIRTYSNDGETVLDNTMGSGTTGVACVNTGRHFIGIERDEAYFDVASKRIADAQAKTPLFASA